MPQMKPMNWIWLFMILNLMIMLMNIKNYYLKINNKFNFLNFKNMKNNNWKW